MTTPRPQLHSLTISRGLAAWLVLLYHVRTGIDWLPERLISFLSYGYLAVDFFFLLSGFVIWMTAHQQLLTYGGSAIWPFLRRRFARIYPLYALMLGLTILFAIVLNISGKDSSSYPWHELPLHISMTQNWGFTNELQWNHPAWSISTEMAAYLLFPILVLCTPIARAPHWALLMASAALILLMALIFHRAGLTALGDQITHYGLIRCLVEFSVGAMVCALWLKESGRSIRLRLILPACVAALAGGVLIVSPGQQLWAFPTCAAACIYMMAEISRRRAPTYSTTMIGRVGIYMGEISYATYLSHFMLFIWFKIAFVENAHSIPPHLIVAFIVLAFGFSALLYHYVELPGRRYLSPDPAIKASR